MAQRWSLPIGQAILVKLNGHHFSELSGRLDLARAPDLPLDPRVPLALRIGTIEFSSRQIASWMLR